MNIFKISAFIGLLLMGSCVNARPQQFDDAESRRRALDGQDMFNVRNLKIGIKN